jgi:hypothetical protein
LFVMDESKFSQNRVIAEALSVDPLQPRRVIKILACSLPSVSVLGDFVSEVLCWNVYSAAWCKFPSCSEYTFTCRGGPIRTGWKNTAAPIVHSSDRAISLPMLEMPG